MFYCTIALDDRKLSMDLSDYVVVIGAFVSMSSMWVAQWKLDQSLSIAMVVVSCIALTVALLLNYYTCCRVYKDAAAALKETSMVGQKVDTSKMHFSVVAQKLASSWFLIVMFPLFPVVYFMGIAGYLSVDQVRICSFQHAL